MLTSASCSRWCNLAAYVGFDFKQILNPPIVMSRILHFSQLKPKLHCCFNSQNREFPISQVKSTREKIFLIFQCSSHTCKTAWYCTFLLLAKKTGSKLNLKFPQGLTVCRHEGRPKATFFFLLFSHISWSLSLHYCSSPWEYQFQLSANPSTQQCCVLAQKSAQEEAVSQGQPAAGCCFPRRATVEWHSSSWGNQKNPQGVWDVL